MRPKIRFDISAAIYLKDPESSELGMKILNGSIDLLYEIGFEEFTFRKLAIAIDSTEASIYRYFESKHKLLLYLVNWYWTWLLHRMYYEVANIEEAELRLEKIIYLLTQKVMQDADFEHIDEEKLYQIIINEGVKSYLTYKVDEENKDGDFRAYKNLVLEISKVILEINPTYPYPKMLVSTLIEGIHHQKFFAQHLPKLTDLGEEDAIFQFYKDLLLNTVKKK